MKKICRCGAETPQRLFFCRLMGERSAPFFGGRRTGHSHLLPTGPLPGAGGDEGGLLLLPWLIE